MYFLIGISLVFTYLYAVNLGGSLTAVGVWKVISAWTSRLSRRGRADLLFLLRVMPLACTIVLSFALLIPSFLLHEPEESGETVSYKLAIVVGISIFGIAAAASRIFASWWRTRRLIALWMRDARPFNIEGFDLPAFTIEHPFPVLAVIGVIKPRIFVATQVLETLNADELVAALAHEVGHVNSRDNLKRVAMRLCGDMLVLPAGRSLDRLWLEAAESAADEFAAKSNGAANALDLAAALVKIGRITPAGRVWELPVGAYLTEPEDTSLASRIEDLVDLAENSTAATAKADRSRLINILAIAVLVGLTLPAFSSQVLYTVHNLTEAILAGLE